MTTEQRNQIFEAILILKGSANPEEVLKLSDENLLKLLTDEACSTMEVFWNLVEENKRLKDEYIYFNL